MNECSFFMYIFTLFNKIEIIHLKKILHIFRILNDGWIKFDCGEIIENGVFNYIAKKKKVEQYHSFDAEQFF